MNTASQTITSFTPPLGVGERPDAVTAGPDGNIWVDTAGGAVGHIDVLILDPPSVAPASVTLAGVGLKDTLTVTEGGTSHWTAVSSNTSVAMVGSGAASDKFTVTSVGVGTCEITISDGVKNSVKVKFTVILSVCASRLVETPDYVSGAL